MLMEGARYGATFFIFQHEIGENIATFKTWGVVIRSKQFSRSVPVQNIFNNFNFSILLFEFAQDCYELRQLIRIGLYWHGEPNWML